MALSPAARGLRTLFSMASCWLHGDDTGLAVLLDDVAADPSAVVTLARCAAVAIPDELFVDGYHRRDAERLLDVLSGSPVERRVAEIALRHSQDGDGVRTDRALLTVLQHAGTRGMCAAAASALATAVQVRCARDGTSPDTVLRQRLLNVAYDDLDGSHQPR